MTAIQQPQSPSRRGHDLGALAVERLRRADIPMTPLNFELWFRAEEYPQSPLAIEVARLERQACSLTQQESVDLAANFLPEHRLAREARENGEQLVAQLETAERAMQDAQTSSRTYGLSLEAGIGVLEDARVGGRDAGSIVQQLAQATAIARADNARLSQQLASAVQEVARLRDHMEVVRRESLTDALTNLPNRKAFDSALAQACASGENVVVAMIDVDHFKRFNDQWGHATGDQVLKFVGAMIGRTAHAPRLAARYGGEEFAILFTGETIVAAGEALENMLIHIRNRQLTRRTTGEQLGHLTVSAGVAEARFGRPADLLAQADDALYLSKGAGRDRITISSPMARKLAG